MSYTHFRIFFTNNVLHALLYTVSECTFYLLVLVVPLCSPFNTNTDVCIPCQGRLVAQPMTEDQTPFRTDELARVRAAGARVMTLDQLEGLKVRPAAFQLACAVNRSPSVLGRVSNPSTCRPTVCNRSVFYLTQLLRDPPQDPNVDYWGDEAESGSDPPRLWFPNGMLPGTAFTRSIGQRPMLALEFVSLHSAEAKRVLVLESQLESAPTQADARALGSHVEGRWLAAILSVRPPRVKNLSTLWPSVCLTHCS